MLRTRRQTNTVQKRLQANPLLERITDRTYVINGGWARGFVFLPDPEKPDCIIIDPGTGKEVEGKFNRKIAGIVTAEIAAESRELSSILRERESRSQFLMRLVRAIEEGMPQKNGDLSGVFLGRVSQIGSIVKETGLLVRAIYATHHHIDHVGVSVPLAQSIETQPHVFLPDPLIFDQKRRGELPIQTPSDGYKTIKPGTDDFGIQTVDISGHTTMVGFLLPDGCLIIGDLVVTTNMWKTSVLYAENVTEHLKALQRILNIQYERMLLSHGKRFNLLKDDSDTLVRANIQAVEKARRAATENDDIVRAAEEYLGITNGHIGIDDLRHLLTTSLNIGAYR